VTVPPEAPRDLYAAAIDQHLRSRRGTALGLSASDWSAVEGWWSRGVPLWIITAAIDEVFERSQAGALISRGLRYCAPIIEERYRTHLRSLVPGAPEPAPLQGAAPARMAERLGAAQQAALGRGETEAARLIGAAASQALALDEKDEGASLVSLVAIGRELTRSLRRCLSAERLEALSREADEALAAHAARMTVTALRTTREHFIDRRVMEIFQLPDVASL
jgi:hypothetical protein